MNTFNQNLKCIVCEKALEPVSETAHMQPYGGGEIVASFDFGSRYDWLGSKKMIYDREETDYERQRIYRMLHGENFDMKNALPPDENLPERKIIKTEQSEYSKNHPDRDYQLAGCHKIKTCICDDCFKKKSHLFFGFEEDDKSQQGLTQIV